MKSYPTTPLPPLIPDLKPVAANPAPESFVGLTSTDRAAREEILHRARAIWEGEGCPKNRELAHWLQAEMEILQVVKKPATA